MPVGAVLLDGRRERLTEVQEERWAQATAAVLIVISFLAATQTGSPVLGGAPHRARVDYFLAAPNRVGHCCVISLLKAEEQNTVCLSVRLGVCMYFPR